MSTLTAKAFQQPLLRALSDLTGGKAKVAVAAESTYAPVMAIMDITDILALGTEAASGQPMVQRQIQWACKNLRKTGQMDLEGRGQWVLTDKGVQEVQMLCQGLPTPVAAPVAATAPVTVQAPSEAVSLPLQDPYILSLLLAQTPCLGYYSAHGGAECTSCPVTTACRNKQYSNLSQVALRLGQEDVQAASALMHPRAPAVVAPVGLPVPPQANLDISTAQQITAFEETLCAKCGKPITEGARCCWVDDTVNNESRILHLECLKGAK